MSSSSSDSDAPAKKVAAPAKVAAKKAASSSSSSDSDAPAKKPAAAAKAAPAKKLASSSSSDSDAPAKKPAAAPAKAAPAKKAASSSSSSDDEAPKKAAPAKAAPAKKAASSSSSSDEEPKKAAPAKATPAKKAASSSSSSDDEKKAPAKAAPAKKAASSSSSSSDDEKKEVVSKKRGREEESTEGLKKAKNGAEAKSEAAPAAGGEDTGPVTVFVGGISFDADEAAMREFFGECGEITQVRLPTHRDTGKPKGIAFMEFANKAGADAALALDGQSMLNRYLAIKLAESTGSAPRAQSNRAPRDQPLSEKPEGCKTVFVGNLAWDATEDAIREAFADCGTVWNVRLAVDKETQKPKGFAHVEFEDEAGPEAAVKKTGTEVAGRAIRVDYAGSSAPKEGGGRGGGRGGFGGGRGGDRGGRGGRGGSRGAPRGRGRGAPSAAAAANKGSLVASQGKKMTF